MGQQTALAVGQPALGNADPTTRRMLEDILAVEEEHADDLLSILEDIGPQ